MAADVLLKIASLYSEEPETKTAVLETTGEQNAAASENKPLIFILAVRIESAIFVDCPVSLCPTTDAVLKKLLSASAFQSYCFLSTLLVRMGLLKVQHCYKSPCSVSEILLFMKINQEPQ